MNANQQNPQRPTRADEVKQERRRKPGSTTISGLKLHIDKDNLDPAYEYRWVNDIPGRVQQLYAEDWDKVENKDSANGVGTIPTQHVGTDAGKPIAAVLMRKLKSFYQDDQKEKQKPLDAMDEAIRRGVNHEKAEPDLRGPVAYTPNGSNTISR